MNKIILTAFTAAILLLLTTSLVFYQKAGNLNIKLAGANQAIETINKEITRLGEEKDKIAEENNKLQADTVSYVGINTKLQGEKESLRGKLMDLERRIDLKEADLDRAKKRLREIEAEVSEQKQAVENQALNENKKLKKKISLLNSAVKKERALYHYNLAVAYTKAQFYDEAVEEYEKSLQFDIKNADAHYNLGLLCQNTKHDLDKAAVHYKKYLELKPDAEDAEEVKGLIEKLK